MIVSLGALEQVLAQYRSTFPMPNVIGLTVSQAEREVLSAAGRNSGATSARAVINSRRTDARPAGQIIQQLDARGSPMRPYMDDVGGKYGEVTFRVVVSTGPTTFSMPNVIGITVPVAERKVLSAGRQVRVSSARADVVDRRPDEKPANQIIRQLDAVGKQMGPDLDDVGGRYGEVVFRVVVSTGPELAPNFLEKDINTAQQYASQKDVNLNVGAPQENSRIPRGVVVQQNPAPGQPMQGRSVTVNLSAGYPLPNYVNRPLEDVRRDSRNLRFRLEQQNEDSLDIPSGIIFEQDPGAGTLLPLGRRPVRVKVSRGWPVPEFVERNEAEADEIANEIRLRLNKTRQDNFEVPVGVIFSQQPPAGDLLPRDRVVNVTISRGYPLPNLVGRHVNEARQLASELNFTLDTRRVPIVDRIADHIDRQSPEPATRLPLDRLVSIVISEGWPTPNFLTLEENEARTLAGEKQVNLTVAERRQDREMQPGIIISQSPLPGTLLPPGQAVSVVVSTGYPTPRLIGFAEAEAMSLAERESIILDTATKASLDFATGVVTDQFPEPGSPLPADSKVFITISSGWPTPDFVGKSEEEANSIAAGSKITLSMITPREHFKRLPGLVIEQQPAAGAVIPVDRQVKISLSLGWPIAPAAVGQLASSVTQEFLARHPNAIIDLNESILTFEPTGTVISQHPAANVKLGPKQRLKLVSSGEKPPWLWPVIGLLVFVAAFSAFKWSKPDVSSSSQQNSPRTDDLGGVRIRVTRDHGIQTTDKKDGDETDRTGTEEIVKIRVNVDLGEQSAGPVDEKGD